MSYKTSLPPHLNSENTEGTGRHRDTKIQREAHTHTCTHMQQPSRLAAECQLFVLNANGAARVRKASSVRGMNFGGLLSSKEKKKDTPLAVSMCRLICSENINKCRMLRAKA